MALTEHHFDDPAAAAVALAVAVASALREGIAARGAASLVVSGGKSPIPFFRALREQELEWEKVWITLADERWVPPNSPDSNENLLRQHLIRDAVLDARFVPLWTGHETAIGGVTEVIERLNRMPRPFDAVVLGMGEDGHTASLFPGTPALDAMLNPRWAVQVGIATAPVAPTSRITLTMRALLDSRQLFVSIAGATKMAVYERARGGAAPSELPIGVVLGQAWVPVSAYLVKA